eukprot:5849153-Prymnesium_polylepis.1
MAGWSWVGLKKGWRAQREKMLTRFAKVHLIGRRSRHGSLRSPACSTQSWSIARGKGRSCRSTGEAKCGSA